MVSVNDVVALLYILLLQFEEKLYPVLGCRLFWPLGCLSMTVQNAMVVMRFDMNLMRICCSDIDVCVLCVVDLGWS